MAKNKESTSFILTIAIGLSLFCASLVSLAAVGLKPIQDKNAAEFKKKNILIAAGIYKEGGKIDELFDKNIVPKAIILKTGEETNAIDPLKFNAVKSAKDPNTGNVLENDPAKISSISKYAVIYQLKEGDKVKRVILPIRGYGLWGTMYGFIALDEKGKTVKGITFYDHIETPGLGAEITNPKWQAKWEGKKPYAGGDTPDIQIVKKMSDDKNVAQHQVDSIAGATLTSRGVENTINFWLGSDGYGTYLKKLSQ